jgi:hypothetical protein
MESKMAFLSKASLLIAGAASLAASTPALADHRDHGGGSDVGALIAGALVIGGIAAIASSSSHRNHYDRGRQYGYDGYDRSNGYDRGYDRSYDRNYDRGYNRRRDCNDRGYDRGGYYRGGYDNGGYDQRDYNRQYDGYYNR